MLVLNVLRQNGFRRIESLLSSPDRALTVQRMQTRKSSALLDEFRALSEWQEDWPEPPTPTTSSKLPHSLTPEAEVSDNTTFLKPTDSLWKVGAQVSAAGGIENAVTNAVIIGAKSFAFYLKSPIQWTSPSLTPWSISEFKKRMKGYGYANNMALPISSLLIHLGAPESNKREKSFDFFLDDLQRCEALGLELYNLRLDFTEPIESYLNSIADYINRAHNTTRTVTIVLKNRDGAKNSFDFSDFARIIANVNDKTRVGVSLDTFFTYAVGYDIRTKEGWDATMDEFDKEIGLNYLRGMHFSDIKPDHNFTKGSRQSIGLGYLGITTFQHILQDPRTRNIPLILATPRKVVWGKEIKLLQALSSTPQSEDALQSLVHELESAIEEPKSKSAIGEPKSKLPHSVTLAEDSDDTTFLKRTDSLWKIGAHVSAAGGIENAVTNAVNIGANSFAIFFKSPLKWTSPSLTPQSISEFKNRMEQYGYANNMVLPISNYLIHLGSPESDKHEKSFECFLDDLQRCEALGLELYNLCLGFTVAGTFNESCLTSIADCINRAHDATRTVTIVLKSKDGTKNSIGSKFSDFARIIAKVKDKTRIGVCLDTFSAISAGYDIKTKEGWDATMSKFDEEIGLNYLRGMLLSDIIPGNNFSKGTRQNIGLGHLGITAFQHILQDPRTRNIPLILATPGFEQPKAIWSKEIGVLQALTPPAIQSEEDLQSLVHELRSVVKEGKLKIVKRKRVVKKSNKGMKLIYDDVVDGSADSYETSQFDKLSY